MEPGLLLYCATALLIFFVSTVFAMLGLGGGLLYVPIFHWLGFPLKPVAIPTGLLLNGFNTLFAFMRYAQQGLVNYRSAIPAAVAALILAPAGAWCSQFIMHSVLLGLFATIAGAAGIHSLLAAGNERAVAHPPSTHRQAIATSAGGLAGFTGGLLGIGGGVVLAPLLMYLGYPTKVAVATTAFIVAFSSFSGFLGHMAHGSVDPVLIAVTLVPVILGSQVGSWYMAKKAKPAWIRRLYGVLLLTTAVKLLDESIFRE